MNEAPAPPSARPRTAWFIVAVLLALTTGVWLGGRWHTVFDRGAESFAAAVRHDAPSGELWTCGMHPQVIQTQPGVCPICRMALTPLEVSADPVASHGGLTIDPVVVQNMGVQTALVTEAPLVRTVRAAGTIVEVESNVRDVTLLVSGQIRRLYADTVGMHVRKQAPLFELYSPELNAALADAIRLRPAAPTTAPDGTATGQRPLYDAALHRLERWGLSRSHSEELVALAEPPSTVTFESPIAGIVTEKRIVEGSAVRAGDSLLRIVDHGTVWLDAKVFEQHIAALSVGQTARAKVVAWPGELFVGKIAFVHPHIDPVTRAGLVRFVLANRALRLRPGMYATVELDVELAAKAIVVPREAVIDTGLRSIAFVAEGGGHFVARDVEVGRADGRGSIEVLRGLTPGESVVTSGQFLLDAESRLREAVQKFLREDERP